MFIAALLFFFSIALIYFASEWLIRASLHMGKLLGWPEMTIGFLVIGIGTSTPEIAVSLYSLVSDQSSMLIGNITGSCLTNCLLIFGLGLLLSRTKAQPASHVLSIFLLALTVIFAIGIHIDHISRFLSLCLLLLGVIGIGYMLKKDKNIAQETEDHLLISKTKTYLSVLISLLLILISAKTIIETGLILAKQWHINDGTFAMSFVAIGTSLPELALALVAARKGYHHLLVGNIIGSNLTNIAFGIGLPGLIKPIPIELLQPNLIAILLVGSTLFFMGACFLPRLLQRFTSLGLLVVFCLIYVELFMFT